VALVAVMPPDHLLAARPALVIADFRDQPLVGFDPDWSPMGAVIRRAFRAEGLTYQLACQVLYSSTVCHMISACGGIGIIDAMTADSLLTTGLVTRPIERVPSLPLRAFFRRDTPLRAAAQQLLRALGEG